MPSHPDILTLNEWVAPIRNDSAQAKQYLIALKARSKQQGMFASPDVPKERIAKLVRLGEMTMRPLPDRAGWQALIEEDATFAKEIYLAIMTKYATMGFNTPQEILRSMKTYEELTK